MAVRSTMSALISRVRLLINDTATTPVWSDQQIQDIMDEARADMYNIALIPKPTFSGSSVSYLDYFSELGGWEDDYVLKQYLTVVVTAASAEPIAGHFHFSSNTFPPLYITGKLFDVYRSAADLLERWASQYTLQFDFSSDGQSFHVSQVQDQLRKQAQAMRRQQRATTIAMKRGDLAGDAQNRGLDLGPRDIDYFSQG
jgi:hypothetical protein